MSVLKSLVCFFFILNISCNEKQIEIDYCKMLERDQSFVNNDKSNIEEFNSDKAKRAVLINQNFELLIKKTKQSGFPNIQNNQTLKDSCLERAVTITMIHKSQIDPDQFYGKSMVKLFKNELEKGNLDNEILKKSCLITAMTTDLCENLRPRMKSALALWKLDKELLGKAKFISCDE